ncbi:MAG TPA: amidohydrolase [Phenylobacterium sp.]|uniref:amidohydrolase n=1 Tax=Phenylobacterium sp. TaxID=1871053 RepID=UPI002B497E4D|nr:amidohydrolase [Phenylobacterium sp.]HKR87116.1 amidohydrolase [Phenylobacterium sp.]
MTKAGEASTAYINGRIYAVDPECSWHEALLVEDGLIAAIGSTADIRQAATAATEFVDLGGRMVMPGLHDAHTHLLLAGLKFRHECRLGPNPSPQQILDTLCECGKCQRGKLSGWIVGGEYNALTFNEGELDRAFLDEAYPDTPVFLYDITLHHGFANSRALELAGITSETPDPHGGRIVRRAGSREPTGELVETATRPVRRLAAQASPDVCLDAVQWALSMSNRYGITSLQEAGATLAELEVLNALDQRGELTVHVATHIIWREEGLSGASDEDMEALIAAHGRYASAHVRTHFVKCWLDGAPLPPHCTESRLDPVTGRPDANLIISEDELFEGLARFDRRHLTVKMHCAAEGAVRAALNAVERVRALNGSDGPRHDVAHALFVAPDDMGRFAQLNVTAEMSPAVWHYRQPPFEVLDAGCKFGTLERNGAAVTIGSDWALTENPNLFPALQGMLDRGTESVSLKSALEMMTIAGARAVGHDKKTGSLEPGKSADFIVLDRNLFGIPVADVGQTRVLMTVFEGKVVYSDADA